jgi:putative spermidine/putrescine transport system permease protein
MIRPAIFAKWRNATISQVLALVAILFLLLPFIVVIGASFDASGGYEIHFPPHVWSLDSYRQISSQYVDAVAVSVLIGLIVAVVSTLLGLMGALAIVRGKFRGKEALQAFFRLPVQIPVVVTGAVFLQFYYHLAFLLNVSFAAGITKIAVAHLFIAIPYSLGAISATLSRIDPSVEEAAQSLGASLWGVFWQVTFPLLRPGLTVGALYGFVMSFGDVPIALFLVNPNTMTFPVLMYQDMQFDFHPSMLAISALVTIFSVILILGVQQITHLDLVELREQ